MQRRSRSLLWWFGTRANRCGWPVQVNCNDLRAAQHPAARVGPSWPCSTKHPPPPPPTHPGAAMGPCVSSTRARRGSPEPQLQICIRGCQWSSQPHCVVSPGRRWRACVGALCSTMTKCLFLCLRPHHVRIGGGSRVGYSILVVVRYQGWLRTSNLGTLALFPSSLAIRQACQRGLELGMSTVERRAWASSSLF